MPHGAQAASWTTRASGVARALTPALPRPGTATEPSPAHASSGRAPKENIRASSLALAQAPTATLTLVAAR